MTHIGFYLGIIINRSTIHYRKFSAIIFQQKNLRTFGCAKIAALRFDLYPRGKGYVSPNCCAFLTMLSVDSTGSLLELTNSTGTLS